MQHFFQLNLNLISTKKFLMILIFICFRSVAQDCPTRIGDFEINSTNTLDLKWILPSYATSTMLSINSYDDYLQHKVEHDLLDYEYSGGPFVYKVNPDMDVINSWYNIEVASPNDSTEVYFVPSYKTTDVVIKNVLLKFYNGKLYFIRASLNKDYTNIILDKYAGKGYKTQEKKTPNSCKNLKFKKYSNTFSQYFFASTENKIRSMLTFDFKVNKYCEIVIDDRIEIFDYDIHMREIEKSSINLEKMKNAKIEKERLAKKERLKRF